MRKVGRKALALTGILFTVACLIVIAGLMWALLDRHDFFSESVRRTRCLANLARIDKGKEEYRDLHKLANGAPTTADLIVEFVEGGWPTFTCPGGGVYTAGAIGEKVACSAHR